MPPPPSASSSSSSSPFLRRLFFFSAVTIGALALSFGALISNQHRLIYMAKLYSAVPHYYSRFTGRRDIREIDFTLNTTGPGGLETRHRAYLFGPSLPSLLPSPSSSSSSTSHSRSLSPSPSSDDEYESVPSLSDSIQEGLMHKGPQRLWVVLGPNAGLALDWIPFFTSYFSSLAAAASPSSSAPPPLFLLVDYPSYGHYSAADSGKPSPHSILQVTQGAVQQALSLLSPPSPSSSSSSPSSFANIRLGLIGQSLGTASAMQFADFATRPSFSSSSLSPSSPSFPFPPIDKIVLISPFTSIQAMVGHLLGPIPFVSYFLQHNFDNVFHATKWAERVREGQKRAAERGDFFTRPKVLIIHGTKDRIVPFYMGKALYELLSSPGYKEGIDAKFVELEGIDHNDISIPAMKYVFPFMNDFNLIEEDDLHFK